MIKHELCYRMGPIRMPHLVDARVGGLPYFYCTCGQWLYPRKPVIPMTEHRMATIKQRFDRHVNGASG